jgi:hypothetical protein
VLPKAIPAAAAKLTGAFALARKAPTKIAEATRFPNNNKAAMAIPVGGQIGDTCVWM